MAIRQPLMTKAYAIAYIEFEKQEEADLAIKEINNSLVLGHILSVEFFDKSQ